MKNSKKIPPGKAVFRICEIRRKKISGRPKRKLKPFSSGKSYACRIFHSNDLHSVAPVAALHVAQSG